MPWNFGSRRMFSAWIKPSISRSGRRAMTPQDLRGKKVESQRNAATKKKRRACAIE